MDVQHINYSVAYNAGYEAGINGGVFKDSLYCTEEGQAGYKQGFKRGQSHKS